MTTMNGAAEFSTHRGEYLIFSGAEQGDHWASAQFLIAPVEAGTIETASMLEGCAPGGLERGIQWLDDEGSLARFPGSHLPPLSVTIFPAVTPGDPDPVPILVPRGSLDQIGVRAEIGWNGETVDIQSPAGRRELYQAAGDAPELTVAVSTWAEELGKLDPDTLPPQLSAGLLIDKIAANQAPVDLPPGVTIDGLARWRVMQEFRRELLAGRGDDAAPSHEHRLSAMALHEDQRAMPAARVLDGLLSSTENMEGRTGDLIRSVFAPLTKAPVETISVMPFPPENRFREVGQVALERGWCKINTEWADDAIVRICDKLAAVMPGYHADIDLFTHPGEDDSVDMLVVRDRSGVKAYAWPTAERQDQLVDEDDYDIPMVAAPDIPSAEELRRTHGQVMELRRQQAAALEEAQAPAPVLPAPGA